MINYIKFYYIEILFMLRLRKRDLSQYTHTTHYMGTYITKEAMEHAIATLSTPLTQP